MINTSIEHQKVFGRLKNTQSIRDRTRLCTDSETKCSESPSKSTSEKRRSKWSIKLPGQFHPFFVFAFVETI